MRPCSTADTSPRVRSHRGFMHRRASDRGATQTVRATARGSPHHRNSAPNPIRQPSSRLTAVLRVGTYDTAQHRSPAHPPPYEARHRSSPGCGSCSYVKRDLISALCRNLACQLPALMVPRHALRSQHAHRPRGFSPSCPLRQRQPAMTAPAIRASRGLARRGHANVYRRATRTTMVRIRMLTKSQGNEAPDLTRVRVIDGAW